MTLYHGTTSAGDVADLDLDQDVGVVAVFNYSGTDVLLVRVDGGTPALTGFDGRDTRVVPPGVRRVIDRSDLDGPTEIRLLSDGVISFEIEV